MRLALGVPVGMMVVGLVVPSALAAQAALTPADSAILASQPLKRLVIAPSLLRRISLLAAGLDREVVLCLQGTVAGDTALVREFVMPDIVKFLPRFPRQWLELPSLAGADPDQKPPAPSVP